MAADFASNSSTNEKAKVPDGGDSTLIPYYRMSTARDGIRLPRRAANWHRPSFDTRSYMSGGFHFIGNQIETTVQLPVAFTPTLRFERASDEQVRAIQKHLEEFGASGNYARRVYESTVQRVDSPGGGGFGLQLIPRKEPDWRYYIFTYAEGDAKGSNYLMQAAEIASPSLWSGYLQHMSEQFGRGDMSGSAHDPSTSNAHYNHEFIASPIVDVDSAYLGQLQVTLLELMKFDWTQFFEVRRALSMLYDLRRIVTFNSDVRVLSLFAILESMLTHAPKLETDDSITHQIVTKIAFIASRMRVPFMYDLFGPNVPPAERVWKALYRYRSAIAHGREANFSSSELRILKGEGTAHRFLDDAVRRVLRHAVADPAVFRDLRPI